MSVTSLERRYQRPGSHPWDGRHPDVQVRYPSSSGRSQPRPRAAAAVAPLGLDDVPAVSLPASDTWTFAGGIEPIFYREHMGPPVVVEMDACVLDMFTAADCEVNPGFCVNHVEAGGYLFSHRGRIVRATASSSQNRLGSLRLDDRRDVQAKHGQAPCGSWHTHPAFVRVDGTVVGRGAGEPSQADLNSCDVHRRGSDLDSWLMLIATPMEYGGWDVHSFVCRRYAGSDRSKIEPMKVVIV